jgi:hypothetical protein
MISLFDFRSYEPVAALRTTLPLLMLSWVAFNPLQARAESYQVDMVIFAMGGGDGEQSRPAFVPDSARALGDQDPAVLRNLGLRLLPEGSGGLGDLWDKIVNGKRYTPLARISFVQTNPQETRGPVLRVPVGNLIETPAGSFHPLDGTVSLHAGHYLHLDADLVWTQRTNDGNAVSWRLSESRRLKQNELNYLDSARLGAVARVTRVGG